MAKFVTVALVFISGLAVGLYTRGDSTTAIAGSRHRAPLPATGQTKCYDQSGKEIPSTDVTCPGQDGLYRVGCPNEDRFIDNKDGTVTDNCTGLQWQKDTADVNSDGQTTDQDALLWCHALQYCEALIFAGKDDWRLPNMRELLSTVDYGRLHLSIDPVFDAFSAEYWSSTSYAANPTQAWIVSSGVGVFTRDYAKVNSHYVRAVRDAH